MEFLYSAFADESSSEFTAQIDALKRTGCQYLEIRGLPGGNFTTLTDAEAKDIRKALEDNGLQVWSLGSPIGKIPVDGDWDAHVEKYKRVLERIRLFSFFMPKGEDPTAYKNVVIDRMGVFAELAKKAGVIACHENEKGIYGDVASRCLELLQAVPDLRAVFDPANFVQCGQETLSAWQMLKPYVDYLHIKDSKWNGQVVPAGYGDGNVAAIVKDYGLAGGKVMTLEPHLTSFVGLKDLEQEGEESVVGGISFESPEAAFDFAVKTLKDLVATL